MTIPLTVRVGDTQVTRRIDDLTLGRNIHGAAECGFNLAQPLTAAHPAFEQVRVFDARTADAGWEGRLEDPGRSVSTEGPRWDMSAIGEQARTKDRTVGYILLDRDFGRWEREQLSRATSAEAAPSDIPSMTGTDGLLMQYPPGQPIDDTATIVMAYRAVERAGMTIGGIEYTAVAGFSPAAPDFEYRLFALPAGSLLRQNTWSTTPVTRYATIDQAATTPIPLGTTRVELTAPRVSGGATNISSDNIWAAFYDITVKAARYTKTGALLTADADYLTGRDLYPHEVVEDLLGRILTTYDGASAVIDTSATYQIDQFAFPDGVTPEQLLSELEPFAPNHYWQVGPSDPATGKASFKWVKWPVHARYEASLVDGCDLPGAEAERYNQVTYRWTDAKGRIRTKTYDAGTTISGVAVPVVPELEQAGPGNTRLVRSPEIQDLADEVGSAAAADKAAAEFLLAHAIPPVSGTLTVARPIYDADQGRFVQPWEIEPGHVLRIRELATDIDDLADEGRDGRCCFRVVGMSYQTSDNTARLELDAPPRTDTVLLARQITERKRKR